MEKEEVDKRLGNKDDCFEQEKNASMVFETVGV